MYTYTCIPEPPFSLSLSLALAPFLALSSPPPPLSPPIYSVPAQLRWDGFVREISTR